MDPLERQIEDAINVDPSPEFVARVRARVAMENTPSRWRMSPFLLTGATLATMAMAVWVVVVRVDRAPSQTMPVAHIDVPAPTPEHAGDATASTPTQTVRPRRQLHAQVIVAADELRGLRQLSDLLRDGTVALTFDDAESPPVKEIVVTPIDIAPLTVASNGEQGDEQ